MSTTIQTLQTQVFATRCGDNLLNKNLTFDSVFSANVVSGSGFANTSTDVIFSGQRSLYVKNLSTTDTLVISGGGDNWVNDFTGTYISGEGAVFQFSVYNISGTTLTGRFRVFTSSIEVYTLEFTSVPISGSEAWQTFYSTIPFYDNYDFIFELDTAGLGGSEIYLDGIKLEIDDKQSNDPTAYTTYIPKEYFSLQTIDVPSIPSNDFYTVVATLTGAKVGDNVNITYPIELITLGLIVGYPIVTADDEVSFLIHNHSGGAINPASGDYTFKIVK